MLVRGGVHVLDELEVLGEAQRDRLLAQVRQLPARDLVVVHAAGGARKSRLERPVQVAHGLPVRLEVADRVEVDAGVALGVRERGDQRRQRRLARGARHRRGGRVDGIRPRRTRGEQRRELPARGVVRVHVHRHVEALAQCA